MDPAGPVLRDVALHKDGQGDMTLPSRLNAIPDDLSQRTPLRYAPVPKMEEIESLSTQDTTDRERMVHIDESLNETFSPTQDRLIDSQRDMTGITESPVKNISPDESPPTDSGREEEFNSPPIFLNRLIDPDHSPNAGQEEQNRTMGETSLFPQGEMYGAEAPIPGNLDPDGLFANPNGLGNSFVNHTFGWDADLETSYFHNAVPWIPVS